MPSYRYLIVGGGMTADAACKGIRDLDADGTIGLVAGESHPPYDRPPLSKALWKDGDERKIWRGTAELSVELQVGRTIVSLDLARRRATDDRGDEYGYERLLLATGGRPRRLPFGGDEVIYFRTVDDYRRLRGLAGDRVRFVVIGGGFIGSEIAAALAMNGCDVTLVFPGPGICSRLFPADLAAFVTDYYRERGVEVLSGASVAGVVRDGGAVRVALDDGRSLEGHGVVAGLGIEPNGELAGATGVHVAGGIAVDGHGRVIDLDGIYAAGDVARFRSDALGVEMRVEHEDHANTHGRCVGANMAGADAAYDHLPLFYSDLFDLGYEAVGDVDSSHETVADWKEPNVEGVVYYLDGKRRVRGVLLWNVWDKVDAAREAIRAGEPVEVDDLRGLIG